MIRRSQLSGLALVVAILIVVGCDAPTPTRPTGSGDTPVRGGRLVFSTGDLTGNFQPILTGDDGAGSATRYMYWPMLERDPATGALQPGLAQHFEVSSDGRHVTFTLRDGLAWSDGAPIDGDDYRYYVEATARSKKTIWKSKFDNIAGWADYAQGRDSALRGVQVTNGGHVIEIALDRASCRTLENLNLAPIPRHLFAKQWDSATADTSSSIDSAPLNLAPPAASGPFQFKEFLPGDQLVVTRNERFFKGPPLLDEIVFKVLAQGAATRNAFLVGNTAQLTPTSADVDYVRQQVGADAREYRLQDRLGYSFIAWNQNATRAPWLADKRVRQALWYGLDVKTIVDKVEFGYAHQVYANTPTASWAYDGSGLNHYGYDPQRARGLLESAGALMGDDGIYRWRGEPMEMRIETNSGNASRASIIQIAQEQYRQIGIKITPVIEAFSLLSQRVSPSDGSVEGVLLGWAFLQPDPEPDVFQIWHSSQQNKNGLNFAGMSNAALDAAIEAGRLGPDCSTTARRKAYHAVDLILNEEAPYTFLYQTDSIQFVRASAMVPPPQPFQTWNGAEKWWVRP